MTGKISVEIRQKIYDLHNQNKNVKEILELLKADNIQISESTIRRTIKSNKEDKAKNVSFVSITEDDPFYFEDSEEEKGDVVFDINEVKNIVKEETQKVLTIISADISESNDKLDEIIKETKKKINKPLPCNKLPAVNVFNTDGLTEQEKKFRRDLIIKIRNYIDCFSDHEIIQSIPDIYLFKQSLYEKDIATLNVIYEEIQIGINQSKDYEQFMNMFSTSLKLTEFISSIMLGINIAGLKDSILEEISEFDLRQLACELSVSRYVTPQKRLILITLKVLLKKILSNDLLNKHQDLKVKLLTYYQSMSKFLGR